MFFTCWMFMCHAWVSAVFYVRVWFKISELLVSNRHPCNELLSFNKTLGLWMECPRNPKLEVALILAKLIHLQTKNLLVLARSTCSSTSGGRGFCTRPSKGFCGWPSFGCCFAGPNPDFGGIYFNGFASTTEGGFFSTAFTSTHTTKQH